MTDFIPIVEAKKMRSGINVEAEVGDISSTRTVNLKNGGTINVADALIFDGVGEDNSVKLTLWGDDINLIKKGSQVTITNGYTNEFKGEVSLTKGKFGQMAVQ